MNGNENYFSLGDRTGSANITKNIYKERCFTVKKQKQQCPAGEFLCKKYTKNCMEKQEKVCYDNR